MDSRIICRLLTCICVLITCNSCETIDNFDEELYLKPLASGHLYGYFQFSTTLQNPLKNKEQSRHYRLFPRSIGELIATHDVSELSLSLTQGLWRTNAWGYPVRSSPPGAELRAWFRENSLNIDETFKNLANTLAGQFCASFNFIDSINTIQSVNSFPPDGVLAEKFKTNSSYSRYAALPKESVCTENLTPWKKLLPCDSNAGLSQLLNAIHVFGANYFSLSLDFRPICRDAECLDISAELKQTVSVVFDPPAKQLGKRDWSLKKTFGMYVTKACPAAQNSFVYLDVSSNSSSNPFHISPPANGIVEKLNGGGERISLAVFNLTEQLKDKNTFNAKAIYKKEHVYWLNKPPPLSANRYITGYGLESGGIECDIRNFLNRKMRVVYLEILPWFLRLYIHTLKIISNNGPLRPVSVYYKPAKDREQPHHLELVLELPPNSVTKISFNYELAFLKWTEYPPDANHGFYINSAVITTEIDHGLNYTNIPRSVTSIYQSFVDSKEPFLLRLYTNTLLVTLPTPDFSMPYNVICLTCTVVALAFGPIHNVTTKRLQPVDSSKVGFVGKLKNQFKRLFSKDKMTEEKKNQ